MRRKFIHGSREEAICKWLAIVTHQGYRRATIATIARTVGLDRALAGKKVRIFVVDGILVIDGSYNGDPLYRLSDEWASALREQFGLPDGPATEYVPNRTPAPYALGYRWGSQGLVW